MPTSVPRILVTFGGRPTLDQWGAYATAVERAGGQPIPMDAATYDDNVDLRAYDGLLTTGGVDVDPALYGEPRDAHTERASPARDRAEAALTRMAIDRHVPLFAICRGAQLLNVVSGGSLLQHLEDPEPHRPRRTGDSGPYESGWHDVAVAPGSLLARLTRVTSMRVNSRHHQAVTPERLAPGLMSTASTAAGGLTVIEAVEVPGHPFALGVQWHPERAEMQDDREFHIGSRALFEGFVAACRVPRPIRTDSLWSTPPAP
jgi:putative glutamine amidotransferase